jgi:CheY-like chemotaxis protein
LLVEDSEFDGWFLSNIVKRVEGVQLRIVEDGSEAIGYLLGWGEFGDRHRFPLPHIILLDWELPQVSGLQFLIWRREKAPDDIKCIPVVVLSGTKEAAQVREAYLWGAAHFLAKTGNKSILQRQLQLLTAFWLETEIAKQEAVCQLSR